MHDQHDSFTLDQRASATISLLNYLAGKLTPAAAEILVANNNLITEENAAEGTLQVTNWELMNSKKAEVQVTFDETDWALAGKAFATAQMEITDHELLEQAAAEGTITISAFASLAGKTFSLGGIDYTEGVHWTLGGDNDATATALAAELDQAPEWAASATGNVITITLAAAGTAGNSTALTTDAEAGVTLSGATLTGGRDNTVITLDEVQLEATVDFIIGVSTETCAAAIAGAAGLPASVTAGNVGAVITFTAADEGADGNGIAFSAAGEGFTADTGGFLTGGRDSAEFILDAIQLLADTNFTVETDAPTTAENFKVQAAVQDGFGATRDGNIVTITIDTPGIAGNETAWSTDGAGFTATEDGTFGEGRDAAIFAVGGVLMEAGIAFVAEESDETTATNIAGAATLPVTVTAAAVGDTVTFTAAETGADGNQIPLSTPLEQGFEISGEGFLEDGADGDELVVGATTLVFGSDIAVGALAADTAENIKTAVHALETVNATRSTATVNIVADTAGEAGNTIVLTTTAPGLTLSGETLEGGIDGLVITLDGNARVEGTDFTFATDEETSAAALAEDLNSISGFTATAVDDTVTVWFSTPGTGGNAKTLVSSDETNFPVSGATLEGGVTATYTDPWDCANTPNLEATLIVSAWSGTGTLDVTPQRSFDGGTSWVDDATPFTQKTATGNQTLEITTVGSYRRYKCVLGGSADPIATFQIHSIPKAAS